MKPTCTIKEKGGLMQIDHQWCDEFNRDNFKHKFYMVHNLWEEAPLPSLYYNL
jgi:hypothetical protein